MVLVEASAGECTGLGYSYTAATAGVFIQKTLAKVVEGRDAFNIPGVHDAMLHQVRNDGRPGWFPRRSRPWTTRCGI